MDVGPNGVLYREVPLWMHIVHHKHLCKSCTCACAFVCMLEAPSVCVTCGTPLSAALCVCHHYHIGIGVGVHVGVSCRYITQLEASAQTLCMHSLAVYVYYGCVVSVI